MEDANLEEIIYPNINKFNSFDEYYEAINNARDACDERGYHRIDSEPENNKECMICYDCELWFDKEFAKSCGIIYRIEKL